MRKNTAIYAIAIVLLILSFLSFSRAYKEMQLYSALTSRSIMVSNDFQKLMRQVTNAAVIHPGLTSRTKAGAALFFTDSSSIAAQLRQLGRDVLDSVNVQIAGQLDTLVRAELSWLLKSNVPDSILHHHSQKHIDALDRITFLLGQGLARTGYLFDHRKQKLELSLDALKLKVLIFFSLAFLLLMYTTTGLFTQRKRRKEKEEELRQQEEKFRAMVENGHDLTVIVDDDLKVLYRSPSAERITGFSNKDREERSNLDEVHEDDKAKIKAYLEEMKLNPGKIVPVSYRMRHKQGHYIWLEGTFISLFHNAGLKGTVINLRDVSEQKNAEQELMKSEKRYRQTLDNMMEGIQIIGFDWRYIYANKAVGKYNSYPHDEMIGRSVTELYPGVEQTRLYAVLQKCMQERSNQQLESEFVFPDGTKKYFDLSIEPVPEGIFIFSVDISERRKAEEEIIKLNHLYVFISAINQSIVHIGEEEALLKKACDIAIETGGFKLARIEMLNGDGGLELMSASGEPESMREAEKLKRIDYSDVVAKATPVGKTLQSGVYEINNDMIHDPALKSLREMLERAGIRSAVSLPLRRAGKMIGVFSLSSSQEGFFDRREMDLLLEAAGDISFALENFDKARKHKATEDRLMHNEKRFRALIEKSTDLKTLTNSEGLFVYASPSVLKTFGYAEEEILNKPASVFFHPEDVEDLIRQRSEILGTPGGSFTFQYRIRHKKGHWIWCGGTLTNMLHEPSIQALVSNFRDISERKNAEEQKEFDKNNLDALINNTNDLLWSVDENLRLITFNQPFFEVMRMSSGRALQKGDEVLVAALSPEHEERFRALYGRALAGEAFTQVDVVEGEHGYAAEISFFPMRQNGKIIGTACHSRNVSQRIKEEKEREKMITDLVRHSKNLEQFAYVVSHNLRGPVANVIGLCNLLNSRIPKKDKELSQQHLLKAVTQLDTVVIDLNKILEARALIGKNKEVVSFSEVVRGIKDSIYETIVNEKVRIELDLHVGHVTTVKSYLYSIFYNLITNSIKYKQESRQPLILISSEEINGKIVIVYKDNGMGMNLDEYGAKVFGLYQRFHLHVTGKGMGLFMVRTQVEALEGSISLKSQPGEGAEFTIELPAPKI